MDIHELIQALRGIRDRCGEELVIAILDEDNLFVDSVKLVKGKPVIILST